LGGIACLIGVAVLFACGVERGKQLARGERSLLVRQDPEPPGAVATQALTPPASVPKAASSTDKPAVKPATPSDSHERAPAPTKDAERPAPSRPSGSRYAVQVVTYSRVQSAKQELNRLRTRGEEAFLVMRNGRTSVCIGPFATRQSAGKKVALLKTRYQDCFIRSL
jgi:cell division septation protein DedD